jgi:large subunit ribosomal protein L10
MPTPEKQAVVQELAELLRTAPGIYLTDFTGLDVEAMGALRRKCRQKGIEYRVVKNRLAKLAVADGPAAGMLPFLSGPTGIATCEGDPVVPAKVLKEFIDEHEKLTVKAGMIEGRILTAGEVLRIAGLPSREILLSRFMGALQSPLRDFLWSMKGVSQGLVRALAEVRDQKKAQAEGSGA